MSRKSLAIIVLIIMLIAAVQLPLATAGSGSSDSIRDLVDQDEITGYTDAITSISDSHYAYRVAGSAGANETASYIYSKFEDLGLDCRYQNYSFTNWDLYERPSLVIDIDGNWSTATDQVEIGSFTCESYSYWSNQSDKISGMVYLPLPAVDSMTEFMEMYHLPYMYWSSYNLTDRVVIVPKEVVYNNYILQTLINKLRSEGPAAVVFSYYYSYFEDMPDMQQASAGGLPMSYYGDYLWESGLACGIVNYSDGRYLRSLIDSGSPQADLNINSTIYQGVQSNVIASIAGAKDPEKQLLITAHYDSVMCSGYIDNAAGIAALLETARVMKAAYDGGTWSPEISVVFVAFSGEELGMVGSSYYVTATDLTDIVAVINLDCVGGLTMQCSHPGEGARIGVDELFKKVADEEDVPFEYIASVSSDQESFLVPGSAIQKVFGVWNVRFSLSQSISVENSVCVSSAPLTMSEAKNGQIGLIHTRFDTSDPDGFGYWNADERLYEQTRVIVGVSVLLLNGEYQNDISDPTWQPYIFAVVIILAVVLVLYVFRSKVKN